MNRIEKIKDALSALNPSSIDVIDESHKHIGHVGAQSGKGHFKLLISSPQLDTLSRIQQHRLIYEHLNELMDTDIHALSIEVIV